MLQNSEGMGQEHIKHVEELERLQKEADHLRSQEVSGMQTHLVTELTVHERT